MPFLLLDIFILIGQSTVFSCKISFTLIHALVMRGTLGNSLRADNCCLSSTDQRLKHEIANELYALELCLLSFTRI